MLTSDYAGFMPHHSSFEGTKGWYLQFPDQASLLETGAQGRDLGVMCDRGTISLGSLEESFLNVQLHAWTC